MAVYGYKMLVPSCEIVCIILHDSFATFVYQKKKNQCSPYLLTVGFFLHRANPLLPRSENCIATHITHSITG